MQSPTPTFASIVSSIGHFGLLDVIKGDEYISLINQQTPEPVIGRKTGCENFLRTVCVSRNPQMERPTTKQVGGCDFRRGTVHECMTGCVKRPMSHEWRSYDKCGPISLGGGSSAGHLCREIDSARKNLTKIACCQQTESQ